MKIRKLASAVLAAVMSAGMCMVNVCAIGDGEATYCFDTNAKIVDFTAFGSAENVGMKLTHTVYETQNGNGSVILSVNNSETPEQQYGGMYVEASQFGLDTFKNCRIEMSVKLCEGAEGYADELAVFSDGLVWLTQPAAGLSTDTWTTVTLVLPDGAANTKVGFTIPTYKAYSGDVAYIDDFAITDSNGNLISNVGDYEVKKLSIDDAASTGQNIGLTIVLVVLILAIVGGIGLIVSAAIRRFS